MSKTCYKCHKKNSDENVFCKKCGTRLEIICPSCGAKIEGDKYCSQCGTQLVEPKLSKAYRIVQEVYHQSLNRQCSCGATNKPNVKYCTQCGKRVFLTKMQKLKILMNILIIVVCISLIPISWSTIKWLSRSTVTDSEGNVYRTVKIGNQLWMNDNLRSSRLGEYPIAKSTLSSAEEAYIYYPGGDSNKVAKLGYFYNWTAASDDVNDQRYDSDRPIYGICPTGWHLPTTDDIENLRNSGRHLKSSNGEKIEVYWSSSGNVFSNQGIEYLDWGSEGYGYRDEELLKEIQEMDMGWEMEYRMSRLVDLIPNSNQCGFYRTNETNTRGHYVRCVRDEPID